LRQPLRLSSHPHPDKRRRSPDVLLLTGLIGPTVGSALDVGEDPVAGPVADVIGALVPVPVGFAVPLTFAFGVLWGAVEAVPETVAKIGPASVAEGDIDAKIG
jgi:hypothetical protein